MRMLTRAIALLFLMIPPAFAVDDYSNLKVTNTIQAGSHRDTANQVNSFYFDSATGKTHLSSLLMPEINDTPDLAMRRVNMVNGSYSAVANNDLLGVFYWQGWGTNGAFDSTTTSPSYGRAAQIHARNIGTKSSTSSEGRLVFGTTNLNSVVIQERQVLYGNGAMALFGFAREDLGISSEKYNASTAPDGFDPTALITTWHRDQATQPIWDMLESNSRKRGWRFGMSTSGSKKWFMILRKPDDSNVVQALALDRDYGNVGFGISDYGNGCQYCLIFKTGQGPTTAVDGIQMWVHPNGNEYTMRVMFPDGTVKTLATNQ